MAGPADINAVLKRVRDLVPVIRMRREEIERARQLPRDLVQQLRETGVFSLTIPRVLGGLEAAPVEIMRAIETAATGDGSTGWCVMVATGNNVAAGFMSEDGAREVYASPEAPSAGLAAPAGKATRVDGGVRVQGRWPFASGITHCDWVWAGCVVTAKGKPKMTPHGPEIIHVCMPVKDVVIHDTWSVSGLCGTGSHDFSTSDLFVPEKRIFALIDPSRHRSEPLYQMPPLGLFVYQLACVSLGIGRAALDEFIELAAKKVPSLYTQPLADKAATHIGLAHAEAALGGARAFLYETVDDLWHSVSAKHPPTPRQLALARAACTQAVEAGASAARTASTLAAGSALYTSSSLQRHVRDAEAVTHHFTVAPHTWEEAGRVLLGRDPIAPVF